VVGWLQEAWLTYQSVVAFIGLNAILALSVYATLACGQLSLANAGFMAIGAYTGGLLTQKTGLPLAPILAACTAVPALVAVPLGLPVLRLRGVFLAIATIGFGEMVRLWFVNWDYTNGALGLVGLPQRAGPLLVYACLGAAMFALWRLRGSRAGYALESIRQDESAARTMGVNTTAYKLGMFVTGAALAGLAGGLEAHLTFMVSPSGYSFSRVVDMLVYAVVGGATGVVGPVVGAAFLTALPEVLRAAGSALGVAPGPLRLFVNGLVLLVVILFLPNGIASLPSRLRARSRERRSRAAPAA